MRLLHKILLLFCVVTVSACTDQENNGDIPGVLNIGILPDEDEQKLLQRYTPLFEYISNEIGIPYKLRIPGSYQELEDDFESGKIDLAYFGGVTFIYALDNFGAVPVVMRDTDLRFTSYFIVHADNADKKLVDFKNHSFSFGSKSSTSGHLMPRYFLNEKDIEPEMFFSSVEYSGAHDKTAYRVKERDVDLGVANSKIIETMFKDGRLQKKNIHILWETPPYSDYVWALQSKFSVSTKLKITNAFLSLNPANPEHNFILSNIDSGGFLPASTNDFVGLKKIFYSINLSRDLFR